MSSTTVHIPDDVLARVDSIARRRGLSRNRLVLESLERTISEDAGEWPQAFFEPPGDPSDRSLLKEATAELERAVDAARRNRKTPLL
jgi:hypothetical protein